MNSPKTFARSFAAAILCMLLANVNTAYSQKEFAALQNATDSTFGYTPQNPLPLKNGNQQKSIRYASTFLRGLRTSDNQTLGFYYRSSMDNPNSKGSRLRIRDRSGMPLNGKLDILDKYAFVTSTTKDTIILYVDIYNKGALMIPVGLKFDNATPANR